MSISQDEKLYFALFDDYLAQFGRRPALQSLPKRNFPFAPPPLLHPTAARGESEATVRNGRIRSEQVQLNREALRSRREGRAQPSAPLFGPESRRH